MGAKFKLLTWNLEDDCIFSREFRSENRAIETAQALENRSVCPHNVIRILRVKETGHRWELAVWPNERPSKIEHVSFYSKKDATFAIKVIKEYDDSIKVKLTKIY